MDDRRFDTLARDLAARAWPRRRLASSLAVGALAILAGWDRPGADAKKKRRKKKKKPPTSCVPDCAGKVCGDADGCAGTCTACPGGKTCQNNQCVDACRDEDCFGSRRCRNGACACPQGLQDCDGQFWCGECCTNAECPGFPNPNGLQCANEEAGSDILVCRCLNGVDCGDGRCVTCCTSDTCVDRFGPGKFCNANGGCECPQGTQQCSNEQGCRDTLSDRFACGPNCLACGAGQECENGACCIGLANDCGSNTSGCCSGLQCLNVGTVFDPVHVCGDPP